MDQAIRILDHDRCFGTGFEQRETSALPVAIPSTGSYADPDTREQAREVCARRDLHPVN